MAVTDSLARIRHIVREELYDDEDAPSVVGRIAKFVAQIRAFPGCRDREILGMAVATQGVVDTDAGIIRTAARFPSWGTDLPLQKMLTECLGADMPVRVDNILRMSALTECRRGRRQGDSSVVHVYCGWEGLGAGIVMDGRVLRGSEKPGRRAGPHDDQSGGNGDLQLRKHWMFRATGEPLEASFARWRKKSPGSRDI